VHFESFRDVRAATGREKEIKGWRREKKVALIEATKSGSRVCEFEAGPSPLKGLGMTAVVVLLRMTKSRALTKIWRGR
jgi:hypothetical protein